MISVLSYSIHVLLARLLYLYIVRFSPSINLSLDAKCAI